MRVSKTIHQTWISSDIATELKYDWFKLNPTFKHNFADDNQIDSFIKHSFDNDVYTCFKRLTCGAAKADFYRYCVLYKMGGVYIDIDIKPICSLKSFIFDTELTVVNDLYGLYNAFISCVQHHPLMKACIHEICDSIENNKFNVGGYSVFDLCGPRMFMRVFSTFFNIRMNENGTICESVNSHYKVLSHDLNNQTIQFNKTDLLKTQQQLPCQQNQFDTGNHYSHCDTLYT